MVARRGDGDRHQKWVGDKEDAQEAVRRGAEADDGERPSPACSTSVSVSFSRRSDCRTGIAVGFLMVVPAALIALFVLLRHPEVAR